MKANQICRALTLLLMLVICLVLAPCAWAEEAAPGEIAENQPVLTSSPISFTIPDHVKNIESEAFYNCTGMTSVYIPASVTSIGNGAFHGCINLTDVYLGGAWTDISVGSDNAPLLNATIHAWASGSWGNLQWQLDGASGKLTIYGSGAMDNFLYDTDYDGTLPAWRSYKEDIKAVEILNGVKSIGAYAFTGCKSLSSITIPSSVTSIGEGSLAQCESLSVVKIPSGVTTIGEAAFFFCENLNCVSIPSSMQTIEDSAFVSFCGSLSDVYYGGTEEQWQNISIAGYSVKGSNADLYVAAKHFNSSRREGSLADLDWSLDEAGTLVISGSGPMYYYSNSQKAWGPYKTDIKTVKICEGVTDIDKQAFSACTSLSSVTIPSSVTSIGAYAFTGCKSLSSITIPSSVTSIGQQAFADCENLSSVTIPSSVTGIDSACFLNCTSLSSVTIQPGVTYIRSYAFYGCTSLRSVTIPESVTYIGNEAFRDCTNLRSVTIPESVTIDYACFWNCTSLSSVTIPSGVTLNQSVFQDCTSLSSVTIPSDATHIYANLFNGCTSLSSVTIPSSVTSIGDYAFYNCTGLKSITIPSSVTSIGYSVCYGCNLSDVYYSGTEEQWKAIDFNSTSIYNNSELLNATIHYNSTQVPVPVVTSTVCDPDNGIVTGRFSYNEKIPNEFTITVMAQGDGLSYSWLWREEGETQSQWKDISQISLMMVISGQTSNAIKIRTEDMNLNGHNYEFMCLVSNGYAHAVSSIVTIHVVDPQNPDPVTKPAISAHPQSVTATGGSASFSVTATGSGLHYQWLVRRSSSGSWENATDTGSGTATLTVSVTGEKNGYEYRCKVFNSAGTAYSRAATLNVAWPIITSITCDHNPITGSMHYDIDTTNMCHITVTASGDDLSYSWKWRKNGTGTWQDMNTAPLFVLGTTSNKIELQCYDSALNGNSYDFMCTVSNQYGFASDTITIDVVSID